MTPSERVYAIREIANRLSAEDWSIIDLTLGQFQLPTNNSWDGDRLSYVIRMVSHADDHQLVALAAHVGADAGEAVAMPAVETSFWKPGYFRLFLSHLAVEKEFASDLQAKLMRFHISAFVAHRDIEPAREWQDEIELALSTCDALAAILTPKFHDSYWTDQEIGFAMGRGTLIVSIRLGQDPYGFIGKFQGLQGGDRKSSDIAEELFGTFASHKLTQRAMAQAVIAKLESSGSWAGAKDAMSLIEKLSYWDDTLISRVRTALAENKQVREAFGVPERIDRFIKSHQRGAG
jgi:hypothetical protein